MDSEVNGSGDNKPTTGTGDESKDDEKPAAKGKIIARMTTVTSELTFYENGILEFKEESAAKSVKARAVTESASLSSGTYKGNVMQDGAEVTMNFTSGKRAGEEGKATVSERDDASNISVKIGDDEFKLEKIQALVTAWRASSGKTVYFYNDYWAMQVIKSDGKTSCHPLVYKGETDKDGDVKLALLDDDRSNQESAKQSRSNDGPVYKSATISGNTMTYNEETYTKIENDRDIVSAWRALTKSKSGKDFLETMYFYSDGTFMIVMNKIEEDFMITTNGFAGTYEGDTTKDGTVYAIIEQFGVKKLPGTIEGKKLTISEPMNVTYEKIKE